MASPVYSAGTPGNLINSVTVAHGATIAAYLDLSTSIEGQVTCEVATPSTAPGVPAVFSFYKAYAAGSAAPILLTSAATASATTLLVGSKAGLSGATAGQKVALQQAGGSKLGEIVTVIGVSGSSSPYTLTLLTPGLLNGYSIGDGVYTMAQTATFAVTPANSSGAYANSTDYSSEVFLGPSQWIVAAQNGDTTYSVTANVTVDKVTGIV